MRKLFLTILFCLIAINYSYCADEIISKRTYNQNVYDLGNGKQNYKIHTAHINYKDSLGNFQPIDINLTQDLNTKQWKNNKASYHSALPEYSDGWFEFYNAYEGANHTIKARPIAEHVKGEYFTDEGNGVIYKDAFGKGIDLKVYAYWQGLKKVIVINEKPADTKTALTFDFELELPATKTSQLSTASVKVKDKAGNVWDKNTALDFKDKALKIGEAGKESYFRNALVWDSEKFRQPVDIELYTKDGKTYLRKTITPDVLEKAVFPLYTDHPTSYYTGAGDGTANLTSSTATGQQGWDDLHDATDGSSVTYTSNRGLLYVDKSFLGGTINRVFLPIDTSGIDDGATVTDALMYLYITVRGAGEQDGNSWGNIVQTSQADPTVLANADYDQCGTVNNPTEGATRIIVGNLTTSAYNYWTLNTTGKGWVNKTGYTLLGIREGHDALDDPLTQGSNYTVYAQFATSEDTDGNKCPYLDVTVSGGTPANSQLIFIN